LPGSEPADAEQNCKSQQYADCYRNNSTQIKPFKRAHNRAQNKGEQNRNSDRDEHLLCPVENRYD